MNNIYKGIIILAIMAATALAVAIKYSPNSLANACIEASEGTDSDICDCLHANGLTDTIWCPESKLIWEYPMTEDTEDMPYDSLGYPHWVFWKESYFTAIFVDGQGYAQWSRGYPKAGLHPNIFQCIRAVYTSKIPNY